MSDENDKGLLGMLKKAGSVAAGVFVETVPDDPARDDASAAQPAAVESAAVQPLPVATAAASPAPGMAVSEEYNHFFTKIVESVQVKAGVDSPYLRFLDALKSAEAVTDERTRYQVALSFLKLPAEAVIGSITAIGGQIEADKKSTLSELERLETGEIANMEAQYRSDEQEIAELTARLAELQANKEKLSVEIATHKSGFEVKKVTMSRAFDDVNGMVSAYADRIRNHCAASAQ